MRDRSSAAPPLVAEVLRSASRPLDDSTRRSMEHAFRFDFARVRVHADERAAASAAAIGARAWTAGYHIALGLDVGSTATGRGREVLAHELAHVVQSARTPAGQAPVGVGGEDDRAERGARSMARAALAGDAPGVTAAAAVSAGGPLTIRRQPQDDPDAAAPHGGGSWTTSSASVNLTPPNVPRDPDSRSRREPVWCQFGGEDRGDECRALQACRTTGDVTFLFHAIFRVDSPAPAPAYPASYHSQPIEIEGSFEFAPASGGQYPVGRFTSTHRYRGRGVPIATQPVRFTAREAGALVVMLRIATPAGVIIYNGSVDCNLIDCV